MLRHLITLLKFAVSLAIIAGLVWWAKDKNPTVFSQIIDGEKEWDRLAIAWVLSLAAVLLTFVRWLWLVRSLDIPFSYRDAFRLGFIGYFFNLFLLGAVGGDLIKAVAIARERPGRRAEAVATVLLDRLIGLYGLFVLATGCIFAFGLLGNNQPAKVQAITRVTLVVTVIGTLGLGVLIVPGATSGRMTGWLARLPKVGRVAGKLIEAVRLFQKRIWVLGLTTGISLVVQTLFAMSFYFIGIALPGSEPTLANNMVATPLAMVSGALPLPFAGLGAFEWTLDFLYVNMPNDGPAVEPGTGLVVALVYRLMTISIALVGAVCYFAARREVDSALEEASDEQEAEAVAAGGLKSEVQSRLDF